MNELLLHPPLDIAAEVEAILDRIDQERERSAQEALRAPMWVCLGSGPYGCGRVFSERPDVCDRCGHDHRRR